LERLEEALVDFTKAVELSPKISVHYNPFKNRAKVLQKLGRFEDAKEDYTRVLQYNSNDSSALCFFQGYKGIPA